MPPQEPRRPYQVVLEALEAVLRNAAPEHPLRVSIGPIAAHFSLSRPPVARALAILVDRGLIAPDSAGKFRRAPLRNCDADLPPINLRDLLGTISDDVLNDARSRATGSRIYQEVEDIILAVLPYGSFRLTESLLASHYGVSRSITNEVLSRLHSRGFIERGPSGRWQVQQITRRSLTNVYEVRQLLEPDALTRAAPHISADFICEALARVDNAEAQQARLTPEELDQIEEDLHGRCLAPCGNELLLSMIRNLQVVQVTATHLPNQSLAGQQRTDYLREHRVIYNALLYDAPQMAAEALVLHLRLSLNRAANWLEAAQLLPAPPIPRYLQQLAS